MIPNFNINFVIFSPAPEYINYIGGVMVNHSLANDLTGLGQNCYLYANSTNIGYNCNLIPWGTDIDFDPRNTVLIKVAGAGEHTFENLIPESLLAIPNKVNWLVNDQVKYYPVDEKLYKYSNYFSTLENQIIDGQFLSIDVDYKTFSNLGLPRSGACFYTKGIALTSHYHNDHDLNLDSIHNIPNNKDRYEYLASVFNTTEYFICYSHRSFIAVLAALCGCTVIVIPYDDIPKHYWSTNFPACKYGIAYGVDDIQWALDTKHLVAQNVKDVQLKGYHDTQQFIHDCYIWLTNKYNI